MVSSTSIRSFVAAQESAVDYVERNIDCRGLLATLAEPGGSPTENEPCRTSPVMRNSLTPAPVLPATCAVTPAPRWAGAALAALVAVHTVLVLANVLAFFVLPFLVPWYVSVPLMTFLFSFMTTRQECQLTNLENRLRQRLGKREIRGFVGHYFVRPLRRRFWPRPEAAIEAR